MKKIILTINIIVSIFLLMIYLSFGVDPEKSSLLAFIPFVYIGLLCINVVFIVFWLIFKWKLMFISIISIFIGIKYLNYIFPFTSYLSSSNKNSNFKVMTYNVKGFDLYNWEKNSKSKMLKIVKDENPDIVCFQEAYWNSNNKNFITIDSVKYLLSTNFAYKSAMSSSVGGQNFGFATVSKYPIINSFSCKFENSSNGFIFTDIVIKNDTVRVYNCHLQSIHLDSDDFSAIKQMFEDELNPEVKGVVKKYVKAYKKRADQSRIVKESIDSCKYAVFVCGDFNDGPLTYTYSKIIAGLKDSYTEKGKFPGFTWDNHKIRQRIDYILFDEKFKCTDHNIIKEKYSDHYAISAGFDMGGL